MQTLMTPDEVSELLQVPVATLAQWRHRGAGPQYRKIGRHVRYERDHVEAWVRAQ